METTREGQTFEVDHTMLLFLSTRFDDPGLESHHQISPDKNQKVLTRAIV
jgi:hypothetical protein